MSGKIDGGGKGIDNRNDARFVLRYFLLGDKIMRKEIFFSEV